MHPGCARFFADAHRRASMQTRKRRNAYRRRHGTEQAYRARRRVAFVHRVLRASRFLSGHRQHRGPQGMRSSGPGHAVLAQSVRTGCQMRAGARAGMHAAQGAARVNKEAGGHASRRRQPAPAAFHGKVPMRGIKRMRTVRAYFDHLHSSIDNLHSRQRQQIRPPHPYRARQRTPARPPACMHACMQRLSHHRRRRPCSPVLRRPRAPHRLATVPSILDWLLPIPESASGR